MFTLIGGDGKEYGPVSIDQVRAWIADGRASLDSRGRRDGETVFRTLREFPEFNPMGSGTDLSVGPPPAAAGTLNVDPKTYADEIIARGHRLDIGQCFTRAWACYKSDLWPMVGAAAVALLVMLVAQMIPLLGIIVSLLLTGVFYGGLELYFLKRLRGQPAVLGDVFAGFQIALVPLMLAGLISSLLTGVGIMLLVLPGIYLAVSYAFIYLLVVDRGLAFWPALEVSRRVITAQWFPMFGLGLICILLAMAGTLALFVGLFFVFPLILLVLAASYEQLINGQR